MFKKQVRIFGRSIPVAAILLALVVVGAAAWAALFLFPARFAVSTTSAYVAPTGSGAWACELVSGSTAVVTTCGTLAGSSGPELVVTGLSDDDLEVRLTRTFNNANPVPYTVSLVGAPNSLLPVCIADGGLNCVASYTIAAASNDTVRIKVLSDGIGPNENIDILGLEMSWSP